MYTKLVYNMNNNNNQIKLNPNGLALMRPQEFPMGWEETVGHKLLYTSSSYIYIWDLLTNKLILLNLNTEIKYSWNFGQFIYSVISGASV